MKKVSILLLTVILASLIISCSDPDIAPEVDTKITWINTVKGKSASNSTTDTFSFSNNGDATVTGTVSATLTLDSVKSLSEAYYKDALGNWYGLVVTGGKLYVNPRGASSVTSKEAVTFGTDDISNLIGSLQ